MQSETQKVDQIEDSIFEIETLQDWQQHAAGSVQIEVGGGGSNNCSNDQ